MLREVELQNANSLISQQPKALVGIYPQTNGRLAVVICKYPDNYASPVNMVEGFALAALKQLKELSGKKVSDIDWFTTYWVSTMQDLDQGIHTHGHGPQAHFAGQTPTGRTLSRVELRTGMFGNRLVAENWFDNPPEQEVLLRFLEASAYQCNWSVPTLADALRRTPPNQAA